MVRRFRNLILAACLGLSLLNPVLVTAQTQSTSSEQPQYGGVEESITQYLCTPSSAADGRDLERCINKLYRFGISFGAIALVFFIVLAGYIYITGGETGKGKAKGIFQNALVGMVILLASYLILSFISPSLVIFKAIQPPIFTAADLPSCDDVGLGEQCIIMSDGNPVVTTSGGGYIACPDGLVAFDKSAVPVNGGGDTEQICKSMMEKLKLIHQKHNVIATATIGPGHDSQCHKAGNPKSGTCVDIVPKDGDYAKLCQAIKSVGSVVIVNESGGSEADCGKAVTFAKTTGKHLHIYLTNGGGATSGGSSGGSRPNCIANSEFKFLCNSPGGDPYPSKVTTSNDSAIQANLTEVKNRLQRAGIDINSSSVRQVYRPNEYSAHLRSYWEAYALIQGKSDDWVKSTGYYCDGSIQYVKKSDIDALTAAQKSKISAHATGTHQMSLTFNTTCLSDHGFGYAVDYGSGSAAEAARLEAVGLCHNLNGGKWNQDRDNGHYVLKEKNRNNQGCR